ncbi:MAG: glycosyltransferase family 2 protein [Eubacterium sp.]
MDTIGVIVPCFNEEDVLNLFYKEMRVVMNQMPHARFQILFVDDGSRDNTLEMIRQIHSIDSRCDYLSFSRNFGKESALCAGLQNLDCDYTVFMDADLQHPPQLIPKMYRMVSEGQCDCAAAVRKDREGESRRRAVLSKKFYDVMNRISDVKMQRNVTDFRMMNRKAASAMRSFTEHRRFTKGMFSWIGFHTEWIEYDNVERAAGESKWSMKKLFSYAVNGISSYSDWMLRLPGYLGGLFLMLGIAAMIVLAVMHGRLREVDLLLGMILLLAGILLLLMRGVSLYIGRIYEEELNRPQYLVKEESISHDNEKMVPNTLTRFN